MSRRVRNSSTKSAAESPYGKSPSRNSAFEECLKSRKLIYFPRARKLVRKELSAAREDIEEAKDRLLHNKHKYATIAAYYAIFHAARALLYSSGYRERSLHCVAVALEALFVQKGVLDIGSVRIFKNSMEMRENADYLGVSSREGAILSVSEATRFIEAASDALERSSS